jgi:hypothetical protein
MGLQLEETISLSARAFAEVRLVAGAYLEHRDCLPGDQG